MPRVSEQTSCENPKVSVAMITYNHEKFIAQAMESVLMQETDFPVELVIGEDCSTDGTRQIIKVYAEKYPHVIRALLPERNLGMQRNSAAVSAACRGEYIACLEGDDYWIAPSKLCKQVDILDRSAEVAGCFSNSIIVDTNDKPITDDYWKHCNLQEKAMKRNVRTQDIFPWAISPANTILFRKAVLNDPPRWYSKNPHHSALDVLITVHGIYRALNEKLGAYRLHPGGVWSSGTVDFRVGLHLKYLRLLYEDQTMRTRHAATIIKESEREFNLLLAEKGYRHAFIFGAKLSSTRPLLSPFTLFVARFFYKIVAKRFRKKLGSAFRRVQAWTD
jgi:glycosyltransferase involved in cell wall biosynthesis